MLQYPLWLGKGSWLRVWDLSHQLAQQQEKNNALKARNNTLDAEVRDLKSGRAAIEERARSELGMVKKDEVFFQVLEGPMPVIAPPVITPPPKADPPIVIKVPNKTPAATLSSSHKSTVSPSPVPKARGPKDNAPKEEVPQEKSKLSLQPVDSSSKIEPALPKKAEEKLQVKPAENDAIKDAKAVLKQ